LFFNVIAVCRKLVVINLLRKKGLGDQKINCDGVNKNLGLVNYEYGIHK